MARRNNRSTGRRNQRVLQIREDGDQAAARIDRTIASMRSNESSTMIICKSNYDVSVASAGTGGAITYIECAATDDFISLAQQYNLFKIKGMRFEVFHINPAVATPIAISTVHGDFTGAPPSTWVTETAVIDSPDAMYVEPGSKKQVFYWNARGTQENAFQDINSFTNYGGLRFSVRGGTAQTAATIVASFLVVFRGRH